MLTEDYCSYEVAKLLDKKGFREYCEAIYFILENGDYRWSKIDIPIRDCSICKPAAISCPTHQMAMKWLREKQGIIITVDYNEDEDCENNERFGFTIYQKDTRNVGLTTYPTYENAVEAALKYCLTNLI